MTCLKLTRLFCLSSGFRQYATKMNVEVDPSVVQSVKRTSGRHHPGQTHARKCLMLPEKIKDTIAIILKDDNHDHLIKKGMGLVNSLHGRHAPLEENEKEMLVKREGLKLQEKLLKKKEHLSSERYDKLVEKMQMVLLKKTKVKENLWKPSNYDNQKCRQYMLLRGPADYAVLNVVLSEIAKRDPDFEPKSVLDFGSGVGTVSWAVEEIWKTCNEFYNIDICGPMRDLAGLVLKRGNPQTQLPPSIFFKGFLPVSLKYTHDLTVSAYTLIEMPSKKQRLETLLSLWNKTDSYLVVIEEGTNAGYRLVIEARDFILEMAEREQEVAGQTGAHVFAPCAHDRACPKFLTSKYPCNFEVTYMQHPLVQTSHACRERYSYVVLKKGPRQPTSTAWPRIVQNVKVRKNHCRAHLCTPEGDLTEIVLSKAKHADGTYKALKSSLWGDTIPFLLTRYEDDELPSKQKYLLRRMERRKQLEMREKEEKESAEEESMERARDSKGNGKEANKVVEEAGLSNL